MTCVDPEAREKFARWCLRYIARHARIQPGYFAGATLREVMREMTETSEQLADEMKRARATAAKR